MKYKNLTDIFRPVEITAGNVLIPVCKLPSVTIRRSLNHPLMTDLRICFNPYNKEVRTLLCKLRPQIGNIFGISDLAGKRSINQNIILVTL